MPENTYTFHAHALVSLRRLVTISLPDGLTEAQVSERVRAACDKIDWSADLATATPGIDGASTLRPAYRYPLPLPSRPPDGAWFEWRGRKWATDSYFLVRDDCPPFVPVRVSRGWLGASGGPLPDVAHMERRMGAIPTGDGPAPMIDVRAEPLVRAAASVKWGTKVAPVWLLDADGAPMAIVMPCRADVPGENPIEAVDAMFARTRSTEDKPNE